MFVILDSDHGIQSIFAFPLASSGDSHPWQCGAAVGQTCVQGPVIWDGCMWVRDWEPVTVWWGQIAASDTQCAPGVTTDHTGHTGLASETQETADSLLQTSSPLSQPQHIETQVNTQTGSREKSEIKSADGWAVTARLKSQPRNENYTLWKLIEGRPGL